jgi:PEP-CTERM motif
MRSIHFAIAAALVSAASLVSQLASADPLPGEILKFQQLPLNNGLLSVPSVAGVTIGAPFPGHDELSTANLLFPPLGGVPFYQGTYMADDFADKFDTPVVHLRWWGSYKQNVTGGPDSVGVKKFLISFEEDVAKDDPTNTTGYSHPGKPILSQIVSLGALGPGSGTFPEKLLPTPTIPGTAPPIEDLYQYNAELNFGKEFPEHKNTVYWLKIVALVNQQTDGQIQWGWHNRDWSIPDLAASTIADGVNPGEGIVGEIGNTQVWHFQDDAVSGGITITPSTSMPLMPTVEQGLGQRTFYQFPTDGPDGIGRFSKDLAFELFTVPEPASVLLMALAGVAVAAMRRRSK